MMPWATARDSEEGAIRVACLYRWRGHDERARLFPRPARPSNKGIASLEGRRMHAHSSLPMPGIFAQARPLIVNGIKPRWRRGRRERRLRQQGYIRRLRDRVAPTSRPAFVQPGATCGSSLDGFHRLALRLSARDGGSVGMFRRRRVNCLCQAGPWLW